MRQWPAALQLCALRGALGPAVCHVHGLEQFDLRGEQVEAPRMVASDWLVAMEAERYRNCRCRGYPGADSAAVYQSAGWWHLRDVPSGSDPSTGASSGG